MLNKDISSFASSSSPLPVSNNQKHRREGHYAQPSPSEIFSQRERHRDFALIKPPDHWATAILLPSESWQTLNNDMDEAYSHHMKEAIQEFQKHFNLGSKHLKQIL